MKPTVTYQDFEKTDIRIGRIISVEDSQARKPTYRFAIDFGPEIGVKKSCAALKNYSRDALVGRTVVAIVNFSPKIMGPEVSEVLILGACNEKGEVIYLTSESEVPLGSTIF